MKTREKQTIIFIFTILIIVAIILISVQANVSLSPGKGFGREIYTTNDSSLLMDRHIGYINYERFVNLTTKNFSKVASVSINEQGDSVSFKSKYPHYFYGQNDEWIKRYNNLPIHINNDGFTAKLETIDSVKYLLLPYQILSNVARLGDNSVVFEQGVDNEMRPTITPNKVLPQPKILRGNKIQTEGIVRQNVADILSNYPNRDKEDQLRILWEYAKDNWNYLNDPQSVTDTWRPANETIEDYYFINGKCYTGDCDDFAILMASFARQIGFKSRFVVAYDESSGHAYAEYYNNGRWIPMDWFSDELGGEPFSSIRKIIYNEL